MPADPYECTALLRRPNADTPYCSAFLDMRVEPVVVCMPTADARRYVSVQIIDLYVRHRAVAPHAARSEARRPPLHVAATPPRARADV